jgi:hypothetical protein
MTNSTIPFGLAPELMPYDDSPERVFLYVTMENYVYETWVRLYCSLFNKTKEEMLQGFTVGEITPTASRNRSMN